MTAKPSAGRWTKIGDWFDERVAHRRLFHTILDEPIVGGARWAYVFGSALTLVFVVQAVTGMLLMTSYAPSATTAWGSVYYITFVQRGGWLVRGLHHFGSQAMVVLLVAHLLQVALYGAYKRPREMNWFLGLGLLACTLGFALTGYLLPWDQKGYWATQVATNIAGTTPVFGRQIQVLMQGGEAYGSLTLTRFHALHVSVLPITLLVLLAAHVLLFRKHGITPSARADLKIVDRFYPKQVLKDLLAAIVVLVVLFVLAMRDHGAPLDAPADPASDYPARPEWYFLSLFQLLKYFHGPAEVVGTLVVPALAGVYLVALPFLDRKGSTALRPRLALVAPLVLGIVGVVALTGIAMKADAADKQFQEARKAADDRASVALALAARGIPPAGPLEMLKKDPELRGQELFQKNCAGCHVLGKWGDRSKATAPVLDGWGTEAWVLEMLHDPDAPTRFAKTPFAGQMPSMDLPPKDDPAAAATFKPMAAADKNAVAAFLASQAESGSTNADAKTLAAGETIVKERCTTCHLYKGEGDDSGQETAPELSGWGSSAWIASQVRDPATKTTYREKARDPSMKGHMPAFADELSADDLALVARWARAHARGSALE